jgi:hypothetical protein
MLQSVVKHGGLTVSAVMSEAVGTTVVVLQSHCALHTGFRSRQ